MDDQDDDICLTCGDDTQGYYRPECMEALCSTCECGMCGYDPMESDDD